MAKFKISNKIFFIEMFKAPSFNGFNGFDYLLVVCMQKTGS